MSTGSPECPALPDELLAQGAYRKIFWRLLPFLMACYTASYLDRVNIGFAKLQMLHQIGLSDTVYGIGAGVFFLGYFLFEVPSNLILQRVGARRWIARIMITWGVISGLFVFTQGPRSFLLLRFLLGVAEAGFYPGIVFYLTGWFPAHRRATILALFASAIPLAGIIGNPISGWILARMSGRLLAGWEWLFLLEAIPAVVLGIGTLFLLADHPARAAWLTGEEAALVQFELARDNSSIGASHSLSAVLRDLRTWQLIAIYFGIVMGQYGLTFWMPTLIRAAGADGNVHIGLLSAIPFLVAILVMNGCARSADRLRERRWHIILAACAGAAGFLIAACSHHLIGGIFGLSLASAGVLTCTPLFWSLPTAYLSGRAAAGGIASINSIGNLAGFASPFVVGYLRDTTGSSTIALVVLAAILLLVAMLVQRVPAALVNR